MQRFKECGARGELEILLVEDNPADLLLFKYALRERSVACSLSVAMNGAQALDQLKSRHGHSAYKPDVVFLDLNLPRKNGLQVLAEMKTDPELAAIPVVVLTGSDDAHDRAACTEWGILAYLNKPAALQDFVVLAREIELCLLSLRYFSTPQLSPEFSAASAA